MAPFRRSSWERFLCARAHAVAVGARAQMRYDASFGFTGRRTADWAQHELNREAGMILKGQVALITGASSGIGRATAEAMAREGARVGVNYFKNQKGAEEAVEGIRK